MKKFVIEDKIKVRKNFGRKVDGPWPPCTVASLVPTPMVKVGIPNFVSGPREYIMEGEYVILAMCSWFRIS